MDSFKKALGHGKKGLSNMKGKNQKEQCDNAWKGEQMLHEENGEVDQDRNVYSFWTMAEGRLYVHCT